MKFTSRRRRRRRRLLPSMSLVVDAMAVGVVGLLLGLTLPAPLGAVATRNTPRPLVATTYRPLMESAFGQTAPFKNLLGKSALDSASDTMATSTPTSRGGSDAMLANFSCPAQICECYILRPEMKIWLNCTVPRLQGTAQQKELFRGIPTQGSALITITCSTPARSYLYDDILSQLSMLQQLTFHGCKFHDVPPNAFRGLSHLEIMLIDGANLVGHVHPAFASHLPRLRLLEIIRSRVTVLPALCGSENLRTLNISYNNIADFGHAGLNCVGKPLSKLEILDVNYNMVSVLPTWIGDSVPKLFRLSIGDNAISEVNEDFCRKLPDLKYLDLTLNQLKDPSRVRLVNCSQLRIFGLSGNELGALPAGSVESMLYVQYLLLDSMGLRDAVWDRFTHLEFLTVLDLNNNSLTTVPPEVLREFPNLLVLNLSRNDIHVLSRKAFTNQYRLKVLDLSSNGMTDLPRQAFGSLLSLEELSLADNSISDVDQTTFTGLRSLVKLDMSDNFLGFIPEQSFATLSSLKVLDLSKNLLTVIGDNAFMRMGSLVQVSLASNMINTLPTMSSLAGLQEVDLGSNNLTSLPPFMFTGLQNLSSVVLRGNRLTSLSSKAFHNCRNLRHLDLSANQLASLSSMHFVNVLRLQHLDLSHNAIPSIGSMFQSLKLKTLLLSHNKLQRLFRGEVSSTLEVLDLSHNQISHISPFTFAAAVSIREVNLTFNDLASLSANMMEISFSLVQFLQPYFYLRGNPLRCDCDLGWLKDWSLGRIPSSVMPLPEFRDLHELTCHSTFVGSNRTTSVTLTAAQRGEFLCSYSRKCGEGCVCCGYDTCYCNSVCPKACRCYIGDSRFSVNRIDCANADLDDLPEGIPEAATEIMVDGNNLGTLEALSFLGNIHTTTLRLNNSDIHFMENKTFRGLVGLRVLHLNENYLSRIYKTVFEDLKNLEELYLQDNEISVIEPGSFAAVTNLRVLNLQRNRLVTVALDDFSFSQSLQFLSLEGNPLTCAPNFTCALIQFLTNTTVVDDPKRLLCYDMDGAAPSAGRAANGTPVLSLPPGRCGENGTNATSLNTTWDSTTTLPSTQELSILIVVSVLSVLMLTGAIVVYMNRTLLELWCFTKFGWRLFKAVPGGREEEDSRPYDAFVSYSNLDEDFVVEELAPRLENGYKHFKLCLHYRDFPVGTSIAETIVKSVESSKRTIMLVSNNYLASEWCKFEFQTAHQQVLTERRNRVIMVLLQDLDEDKLDQTLRLYMRTRTYLKFDDPWFWEKLLFAMPDRKDAKFERLPSTRDLEYMARFGRSPTKSPVRSPASTRNNSVHSNAVHSSSVYHPQHLPQHHHPAGSIARGNGHVNAATDVAFRPDMYEIPLESSVTYERVNESMSPSSSFYNGGSIGAASGHYEEVTPRGFAMRPMADNCSCHLAQPPPLPPLPKSGLLSQEEVRNSPRHSSRDSSREALSKEENWV